MSDHLTGWDEVYSLMARLGVDPRMLSLNYGDEESESGWLAVALPDTRVGVALPGDDPQPLQEDGWSVEALTLEDIRAFSRVYRAIHSLSVEHVRRWSAQDMMKSGSKDEERLLAAMLRANVPAPERNHRLLRESGKELTTPDFAWPSLRVAFFLDGMWWHTTKDDADALERIRELADDNDQINTMIEERKSKAQRDADIRSEMQADGWRILTCTDKDVEEDAGVRKQVERIKKVLRTSQREDRGQDTTRIVAEPDSEGRDDRDPFDDVLGIIASREG